MNQPQDDAAATTAAAAEPGWYLDVTSPGFNRYWDGAAWTESLSPVPVGPGAASNDPFNGAQAVPKQPTNSMAIASLVVGIVGFVVGFITAPVAVVLGHVAISQTRKTNEEGRGLAIAGLVLGYLGVLFWIVIVVLVVGLVSWG